MTLPKIGRNLRAYSAAIAAVSLFVALRVSLAPVLGVNAPLILFLIPVAFAAWYGGFGPGIVATLLSVIAGVGLFATPSANPASLMAWIVRGVPFTTVGLIISAMAASLEAARIAARQAVELQRRILDSAPDFLIFTTDERGRITSWSGGSERTFGWTEAEALAMNVAELFTPEDRDAGVPQRDFSAARDLGRCAEDRWHVRKDGTRFLASGVVTPLRERDGRLLGFTKVARDVTEQHTTRRDLAEARQRSDAAMLAGNLGTFEWNVETDRLYGDEHFARMFAIDVDADGAAPLATYVARIHPDDREQVARLIRHSLDTGADYEAEYRIIVEATVRHVLVRSRMICDATGRVVRFPGVVIDITDRKRLEAARQLDADRYRTLFDAIDEGFCVIRMVRDADGRPIDWVYEEANPEFFRQTGLPREALGRTTCEAAPGMNQHWIDLYGEVASTGVPVRYENFASPLSRWFEVYAFAVPGEADRVGVLFKDITAQRASNEAREESLRLSEEARTAAEQTSRAKDDFLATVSHELRTPLSAIVGWAALLSRPKMRTPAAIEEGLAVIARNAAAQSQLIEDILDMSRITSGKVRLNSKPIDLRDPIRAAVATVANGAQAKEIELAVDCGDDRAEVVADADRLQQVFWNLLANAIKFTDRGGRITVTLRASESRLVAEVVDNGQGMAREFVPCVFDRFRQADMSSTRRAGGLGLGLSIVRHLVELHGGTVQARSDGPGCGSTFRVELPTAVLAEKATENDGDDLAATARKLTALDCADAVIGARILVLDDHPDARGVIQAMLVHCDAEAAAAGSVADAIGILTSDPRFDVVISDIGMPDEDGYAFLRRLRELEAERGDGRRIPVIALTAFTRSSDRDNALAAGFDAYLAKPVQPAELLATLDRVLRKQ